jgi:hypothetical protein
LQDGGHQIAVGKLHFFFLLIFATIRFFSIFFRKWANLVAGLRGVCRPFPATVVSP